MANGLFAKAAGILTDLQDVKGLEGFASYNLGIALIRDRKELEGRRYLYRTGQIETEDQPLFVSPVKTATTLGYQHGGKHAPFGEVTLRVVGEQNRVPEVSYLDDLPTSGFTVVNALTGLALHDRVRLTFGVNNLFDEVYSEPFNARNPDNPVIETGRNLIVTLTGSI